jgi:Arc/MetJ-type ribon-helix-helix transcriptional regulator
MAVINVKVPDEQKEEIERIVEEKRYPSLSEYVREAIRDKIEDDLELREGIVQTLKQRATKWKDGETELHNLEDIENDPDREA